MKSKIFLLLLCFFVSVRNTVSAQNSIYKTNTEILYNGFKTGDYALIKPLLDDKVKISNMPTGMNDAIVPQLLTQLPKPQSYKIVSAEKEGANTRVRTIYVINGANTDRSFLFNPSGKVLELDILGNATATFK